MAAQPSTSMAPQQLPGAASDAPPRAIFCKGLAKGASERCIASLFTRFGAVVDCQIARHRSGRSAGFAIVTFASHEEASAALQGMESSAFMGRPLSCRWYQQDRDGIEGLLIQPPRLPALQQQLQQQPLLPTGHLLHQGLPSPRHIHQLPLPAAQHHPQSPRHGTGLCASTHIRGPATFAAATAPALDSWGSLPQPAMAPASSTPSGPEEGPDGNRRWSAMVNLWLQDYLDQDAPAMPGHSSLSEPGLDNFLRRSFDSFPPPGAVATAAERRRSSRDSLSRCLDSLNLAAGGPEDFHLPYSLNGSSGGAPPCDSTFLAKSRLATKWITESSGGGGGSGASSNGGGLAASAAAAAAASLISGNGGRSSDDFHVLADIKLLSSALSCPPDAASFLSAWGAATGNGPLKLEGVPSAPTTAANSPPGKLAPPAQQRGGSNWRAQDGARRQLEQGLRDGMAGGQQASHGGQSKQPAVAAGAMHLPPVDHAPALPQQQQALHMQALQVAASAAQHQQQHQVQQVHQLAVMHQAQEQYVSALNQLTSAHTQVLAAAAALQGAGILPSVPPMASMGPAPFPGAQLPPKMPAALSTYPYNSVGRAARPAGSNNFMLMRNQGAPQMSQAMF